MISILRCDDGASLSTIKRECAISLSEFFKVMSDPMRLRILCLLMDREICVQHIAQMVEASESAVSHQLRILRQHKLVKHEKHGKKIYYSLCDEHIGETIDVGCRHLCDGGENNG